MKVAIKIREVVYISSLCLINRSSVRYNQYRLNHLSLQSDGHPTGNGLGDILYTCVCQLSLTCVDYNICITDYIPLG